MCKYLPQLSVGEILREKLQPRRKIAKLCSKTELLDAVWIVEFKTSPLNKRNLLLIPVKKTETKQECCYWSLQSGLRSISSGTHSLKSTPNDRFWKIVILAKVFVWILTLSCWKPYCFSLFSLCTIHWRSRQLLEEVPFQTMRLPRQNFFL